MRLSQGSAKEGGARVERLINDLDPTVPGFTSPAVLGLLYSLVVDHRPLKIVEIGSFMGRSSCVFSSALAAIGGPDRTLYCVDLFDQKIDAEYLSYPLIRQIMEYGRAASNRYTDLARISTLSDAFDLTVSRFACMQINTCKVQSHSGANWNKDGVKFDFSYIDGDHSYQAVRRDTLSVMAWANADHMVVFDDYSTQFPGVVRFVEEMRECDGVELVAHQPPDIAFLVRDPGLILQHFSAPPLG
jgi:hypothetical protein